MAISKKKTQQEYYEIYRRFDPDGDLAVHAEFETNGSKAQIKHNIREIFQIVENIAHINTAAEIADFVGMVFVAEI